MASLFLLPAAFLFYRVVFPPPTCPSKVDLAKTSLRTLRNAVSLFVIEHPDVCPDLDALVSAGALERTMRRRDPWHTPYIIECAPLEIRISSAAMDRTLNTDDDLMVVVERE